MERFNIKRKGYSPEEVDNYISTLEKKYNEKLTEQTERIDALKLECAVKDKELAKYREKESDINEALLTAIEKAKEMDYTAKIRFTLEGERIKIFRSKWINYCDRQKENLRLRSERDTLAEYLDAMDREIAKVLERDIGISANVRFNDAEKDYIDESKRNNGFNLDDINNPPDLKRMCQEIDNNEDDN